MPKEYRGCSRCRVDTYWIVKANGTKCTGCGTEVRGRAPFHWRYEGCSKCRVDTYWIYDGDGFEVCTRCGTAG